jgi:hypothetical protein
MQKLWPNILNRSAFFLFLLSSISKIYLFHGQRSSGGYRLQKICNILNKWDINPKVKHALSRLYSSLHKVTKLVNFDMTLERREMSASDHSRLI